MAPFNGGPCGSTRKGAPVRLPGTPILHGPPPFMALVVAGSRTVAKEPPMADNLIPQAGESGALVLRLPTADQPPIQHQPHRKGRHAKGVATDS